MIENAKKHIRSLEGKILLGLSGGPDSMCLLALLMEEEKEFEIAHIDHGLQKQSSQIASELERYARDQGVVFHLLKLRGMKLCKSNLEDQLRKKRLKFFADVMKDRSLSYLVLGHQKDERVETSLKRFFEGGNLFNLCGIRRRSENMGIKIERPLLGVSKAVVIDYLEKREMFYFVDPTNIGNSNLRARMRSRLIPMIEAEFGKKIGSSVEDLATQAEEASEFIERECRKIEASKVEGFCGTFYPGKGLDPYLMRQFAHKKIDGLSKEMRRQLKSTGKLETKNLVVSFEDVGLFILQRSKMKASNKVFKEDLDWETFFRLGDKVDARFLYEDEEIHRKDLSEYHRKYKTPKVLRALMPISLTAIVKRDKIGSP